MDTIAAARGAASLDVACHIGTYRLEDGSPIDLRSANDGKILVWRHWDGSAGNLRPEESGWKGYAGFTSMPAEHELVLGDCAHGLVGYDGMRATRLVFDTTDSAFESGGATLKGRLVRLARTRPDTVVVLAHGSGRNSALRDDYRSTMYAAQGLATFAFDKRGTGASGGEYTQDFELLADDLVAAMAHAKALAGNKARRFGYRGTSQAGWTIPLATLRSKADFAIVNSGIAASPAVEDRNEVMAVLRTKGWGPDVLAKARAVTDATAAVIGSNFTDGFEEFNRVVALNKAEPWFADLAGEFTGEMIKYTEEQLRVGGPAQQDGTPWLYDAEAVLARMETPLLWIVSGADSEGPGPETPETLCHLACEGRPVTAVLLPGAEHGGERFALSEEGRRMDMGYARSLFELETRFALSGRVPSDMGEDVERLCM